MPIEDGDSSGTPVTRSRRRRTPSHGLRPSDALALRTGNARDLAHVSELRVENWLIDEST